MIRRFIVRSSWLVAEEIFNELSVHLLSEEKKASQGGKIKVINQLLAPGTGAIHQ
ncbi:MAG: hypothetical protein ACFFBD_03295 [Candidatus Hodarchaeota archaeon]